MYLNDGREQGQECLFFFFSYFSINGNIAAKQKRSFKRKYHFIMINDK